MIYETHVYIHNETPFWKCALAMGSAVYVPVKYIVCKSVLTRETQRPNSGGANETGKGSGCGGSRGDMYKKTEHSGTDEHNSSSDRANLNYVSYIVVNGVTPKRTI